MIKRILILLVVALVILAAYRWWAGRPDPPPPAAFTQVCAAPACSDDEAIYALLRGKLGWFQRVPQVDRPPYGCAPTDSIDVYRPSYTPDYRFALVGIIRDGSPTESYTLLLKRTDSGWAEIGPYGIGTRSYDCNF